MSKIVVFGLPAHGHVNPTLPVVRELVRRGEEVIYCCHEEFREQVSATGASFCAYPASPVTPDHIAKCLENGIVANVVVLALEGAEVLTPFSISVIKREQPDLVVIDSFSVWGYIAANSLKLPLATFITHLVLDLKTSGLPVGRILGQEDQSLRSLMPMLAARKRLVHTYGRDVVPTGDPLIPMRGELNIIFTIRELQPDVSIIDESFHFVGPSLAPRHIQHDSSFNLPSQPFVFISLGTIHNSNVDFFRTCFAAFADAHNHFLMAVGKTTNVDKIGSVPANFSVYSFVPQLEVLANATAFISHGGLNSVQESLYFGVPMIVVPHQIEQLLNAQRVAAVGAGIVIEESIEGRKVLPECLWGALGSLTSTERYLNVAQKMQQKMRAAGGFLQASNDIQRFIASKNPL